MSLLQEIQTAVVQEGTQIGPILLKLRLLAARLGSTPLEDWVRHESEGYPADAQLPDYRIIGISYVGSFSGPFGSGIRNAPIPSYLIEKFAGTKWTHHEMRQSISAVDELIKTSSDGDGTLVLNASNLILLLQGKIYADYACNSVVGHVSRAQLVALQHAVRTRILELTISLERTLPAAAHIGLDSRPANDQLNSDRVSQITNQVVYGNVTSIVSSGTGAVINLSIRQGDQASFVDALEKAGIPRADALELSQIVATEKPESKEEPFGARAKAWLVENLKKAASGVWKVGVSVATEVLKEASLRYYGLK